MLKTGATMHILPKKFFMFPILLMKYLKEHEITVLSWATAASDVKINTIIKGIPQSLYAMGRLAVRGSYTADQVLEMLKTGQRPQ